MKVALMTGSYPPDVCGVADYSARLEESLRRAGVDVEICTAMRWTLAGASKVAKRLDDIAADVVHIQYPATGYGWVLGPQLVSLLKSVIVTIHECSQTHFLRKLSLYPFSFRAKTIIFTNEFEYRYASRFAPWIKGRSIVIPIGNNIPLTQDTIHRNKQVITYFGLVRPRKGLEDVLTLAELLQQQGSQANVKIVGTVLPGNEAYLAELQRRAAGLSVQWMLGLDDRELSKALAETEIAYLPFVDGASERRSSLIAMLANQAAVVTTLGAHTPPAMESAVSIASTPNEAAAQIFRLLQDESYRTALQRRAFAYAEKFSWEKIASKHIAIYGNAIAKTLGDAEMF